MVFSSFFLCAAIEIDGILHSLRDPLIKIDIHPTYKQSSFLFLWFLLISSRKTGDTFLAFAFPDYRAVH